ncbi:MAG: DUF1295 domain-containing protein [Gammaproteobacteria bacterium]|jgi:protein-S-isoprenylcysteine O-methyltransferase Ste14|nr:DUF1295 domain-containing protein [Gammaproteobacteria bacterium]MDH3749288.1 DUF1295 domain-containing protein [Gammaproteobacteria bacterium]
MIELRLHGFLVLTIIASAAVTFALLLRVTAPYGRHVRAGWGPTIPARVAWIVMESPATLLFVAVYFAGDRALATVPLVLLAMWQLHYINRTFIYPLRIRESNKRMPISVAGMAFLFNCLNAYINARWISHFAEYPTSWLASNAFVLGALCFSVGWAINQHADTTLLRLRQRNETDYQIPRGGLYRWISCPNYFGEMLEWVGWAIATWSLAGTAFAAFTVANLLPRALANHRWYQQEFAGYPSSRRAVIPYLL